MGVDGVASLIQPGCMVPAKVVLVPAKFAIEYIKYGSDPAIIRGIYIYYNLLDPFDPHMLTICVHWYSITKYRNTNISSQHSHHFGILITIIIYELIIII